MMPMGFYIRKALKVGPVRFNFSKSGVGMSTGVTGFRVGTGPRGNYLHMGRGGLYFRQSLNASQHRSLVTPAYLPPVPLPGAADTVGPMQEIESAAISNMTDAASTDLLRELNDKRQAKRNAPIVMTLCVCAGAGILFVMPPAAVAFAVAAIPLCRWVAGRDELRRTTLIIYNLEPEAEQAYEHLHTAFDELRNSDRHWHLRAKGDVKNLKYHAGAGTVVDRHQISITRGLPALIKTNVEIPLVPVGRQLLAFMPDRVLVIEQGSVGAVGYNDLVVEVAPSRFIEEGTVPKDAEVVGTTWKYVNKKGGPDRRFKDNRQIPVCLYESVLFSSGSGLNEMIEISKRGGGAAVATAIEAMRRIAPKAATVREVPAAATSSEQETLSTQ
jgi:hypothetical protein